MAVTLKMQFDPSVFDQTRRSAAETLLSRRTAEGDWIGRTSSSAVATAAIVAQLKLIDAAKYSATIRRGEEWLLANRNDDGGWGDASGAKSSRTATELATWAMKIGEAVDAVKFLPEIVRHASRQLDSAPLSLSGLQRALTQHRRGFGFLQRLFPWSRQRIWMAKFLADTFAKSIRDDGSWRLIPEDRSAVTSQSVSALAAGGNLERYLGTLDIKSLVDCAFMDAPEKQGARDISERLIAMAYVYAADRHSLDEWKWETNSAIRTLLKLQGRDGGVGEDACDTGNRSDTTAHVIRAWRVWQRDIDPALAKVIDTARLRAYFFLEDCKQPDGSWLPQHFGSAHQPDGANPLMGTSRVMLADHSSEAAIWIVDNQNADGSWSARRGGPASIEETAAAISALTEILLKGCVECGAPTNRPITERETWDVMWRGVAWLTERTNGGTRFDPAPIERGWGGIYFCNDLSPVIATVEALERVAALVTKRGAEMEKTG